MKEGKSYYMALVLVCEFKASRYEELVGMCPVYKTREEAEEAHPEANVVEIGLCKELETNGDI